jgi:hypothetical protein
MLQVCCVRGVFCDAVCGLQLPSQGQRNSLEIHVFKMTARAPPQSSRSIPTVRRWLGSAVWFNIYYSHRVAFAVDEMALRYPSILYHSRCEDFSSGGATLGCVRMACKMLRSKRLAPATCILQSGSSGLRKTHLPGKTSHSSRSGVARVFSSFFTRI